MTTETLVYYMLLYLSASFSLLLVTNRNTDAFCFWKCSVLCYSSFSLKLHVVGLCTYNILKSLLFSLTKMFFDSHGFNLCCLSASICWGFGWVSILYEILSFFSEATMQSIAGCFIFLWRY